MSGIPFLDIITGWALRLAYLRLTASPHTAWMASCSLLHMIEAAGLHWEPSSKAFAKNIDPNIRRRLLGFAQYVNMWILLPGNCAITSPCWVNPTYVLVSPISCFHHFVPSA
ncbi:hypothetical protein V1523DRAFT_96961 [Lipomyces doorenjongii]